MFSERIFAVEKATLSPGKYINISVVLLLKWLCSHRRLCAVSLRLCCGIHAEIMASRQICHWHFACLSQTERNTNERWPCEGGVRSVVSKMFILVCQLSVIIRGRFCAIWFIVCIYCWDILTPRMRDHVKTLKYYFSGVFIQLSKACEGVLRLEWMQKEESFAKRSPCLWQLTLCLILTINKILQICAVARKPPGKEDRNSKSPGLSDA